MCELCEKIIDEITKFGVVVNFERITDDNYINHERKYVGEVIKLDFSEHDKAFEDMISDLKMKYAEKQRDYLNVSGLLSEYQSENESLKKRISELEEELESKETEIEIPLTPIEVANYIINHTTHADAVLFLPERDVNTFDVSELEQIAEHLLVYCKYNSESE